MIKKEYIIMIVLVIALILLSQVKTHQMNKITGGWDISEQVSARTDIDPDKYLIEEKDFDYSDEAVFAKATEIKQSTSSSKEAIKETAKFVANHVRYSGEITANYCYSEKASDVLESGIGDCVSMSRLVTALLRAQGIPARTTGGCLTRQRCGILFAAVPGLEAQTVEMIEGDFKKRGFLHEWVEVWEPEQGWVIVEATAGMIFSTGCETYLMYSYDTNNINRCVINDLRFFNTCRLA